MSLPTNAEILTAVTQLLGCRDSRRGRKPGYLVTIITNESGTTTVIDHNTNCKVIVGKRTYKKRATKYEASGVTAIAVPVTEEAFDKIKEMPISQVAAVVTKMESHISPEAQAKIDAMKAKLAKLKEQV